jgi:hypothetical protein
MSDTSGLVPTYLAEIFNRAIPDPIDDNSPFQGFSAPVDGVTVADDVIAAVSIGPPYGYGHGGALLVTSTSLETGLGVLTGDGTYFSYGGPGRYGD